MEPSRVAFYGRHEFYRNILAPIRQALEPDIASVLTGNEAEVVRFQPRVLLLAAHDRLEYFRHHLPFASIGNVRHGLVSKNVLLRTPPRQAARAYDFLCVGPEDSAVDAYRRAGAAPVEVWRTGYPQLDPLHRRDPPPELGLDPGKPTVLYAPTWNLGLSSAPMLGEHVADLIRAGARDANIIIKPHPMIGQWRPRWMAAWSRVAQREHDVLLVRNPHADVTPYMLAADVLISDASSVIFEFLALDRPIVQVTNPHHRADVAYDPDDLIWRWRDVGAEVNRASELPAALAAELIAPGAHQEQRRRYATILFGGQTDGQNARRVAILLSQRSRDLAARNGQSVPRRLPLGRWILDDLVRSVWQLPGPRSALVNPLERRRLARRQRALAAGRLRTTDGRLIEASSNAGDGRG